MLTLSAGGGRGWAGLGWAWLGWAHLETVEVVVTSGESEVTEHVDSLAQDGELW